MHYIYLQSILCSERAAEGGRQVGEKAFRTGGLGMCLRLCQARLWPAVFTP